MIIQYFHKQHQRVVIEREVRSVAGILFAIGSATFWYLLLTGDVYPLYLVVPVFWFEFVLKVTGGTAVSPIDWLGGWLVRGQKPDFVSLSPKLFAWSMGLAMSSVMLLLITNGITGWPPFLICGSCLFFMWLESVCGFCVGCSIYRWLRHKNQHLAITSNDICCAGNYCETTE